MVRTRVPLFAVAAALGLAPVAAYAADVTIYRCTDARGNLTLRDTPCMGGEKQEARAMVRPKDPPLRPAAPSTPAPTTAYAREPAPRYVVLTPPQPLYECVNEDGDRYTSSTGEGRARWEPLWAMGYPVYPSPRPATSGLSGHVNYSGGKVSGSVRFGDPRPTPRPIHPPIALAPAYGGGQWVYDECHQLPPVEVCDRLRDQRYELTRRWNIAQPSERTQLDRDTRSIDARLANDCGGA